MSTNEGEAVNEFVETKGSWTIFGLPRSHWHCQLENLDWSVVQPASLKDRVEEFCAQIQEGKPSHLLLHGPPGSGKTHIGVGIYRRAVTTWGTQLVTWVNIPQFCDRMKAAYGGAGPDPFLEYEDARRLVVLDDLFGRELTAYEINQAVYRVIDTAYQNGAGVVINMNQNLDALRHYLNPHEVSRILAGCTVIPVRAVDRRVVS